LFQVGADIIILDFREHAARVAYLFAENRSVQLPKAEGRIIIVDSREGAE
jgi:hypothetical protein